ncbi:MAG: RIP metalloprotease RseP [Lachnospiraceae bacterium]|nr:RIP metalloprotease RseP [Lachnospiraceae bacterium]
MRIVIALLIFSFIIIFHELGHLLVAKKNGIKVVEFSLGLGPTIIGKEFGGTKYSLKLLPFGGACQMLGEDDLESDTVTEGSFYSASVWARMATIFAGPLFNFILAFLFSLVIIGIAGYDPAIVNRVYVDSPADVAGLKAGDEIKKIGKTGISIGREGDSYFLYNEIDGSPIEITYLRDGEKHTATIYPTKYRKYVVGFTYNAGENPADIKELVKGGPLENMGAQVGDVIVAVNGTEIANGSELRNYFNNNPLTEEPCEMTLERKGEKIVINVTPLLQAEGYQVGFEINLDRVKANALQVVKYSFVEVRYWIVSTVKNLGQLISGKLSKDDVGGAIAIVDMIGESYEQTKAEGSVLEVVLQMMYISVLLSANLGVMNLLPIPALDGGKLLFLIVEAVRRKPLNRKMEAVVNLVGFALLMLLMVFVFYNDIRRLIGR